MADIYDQHRAAFANVSAYVIALDGKSVAKIAFKYPANGAGRLYAYVHWLGVEMVRGFASGGGYDKHSAAAAAAITKARDPLRHDGFDVAAWDAFRAALAKDDGAYWDSRLRAAGFEVWQAV